MKERRWGRAIAGLCILATISVGVATSGAAGAASDAAGGTASDTSGTQFSKLKPIKAPNPCKNDPGVSDSEIKIGSVIPTSGPASVSFSIIIDGINARFAKANAESELGNRKLTLVNVDDAGDVARNVTAAQQLAEEDKVFAIINGSAAGDASGQYLHDQGIPVVGWQLGLPAYGTYPNYFGMQNANTKDIKTHFTSRNADVIKALGGTKLAIVGSSVANSVIFTEQVAAAANKTKGLKTVYLNHDVPLGTTEFGSVADQIKQSGANSLYTAFDNTSNTGLMAALKQAGVKLKPIIFPGGYDPRVLGLPTYDDVYFGIEFKPFEVTPSWPGLDEYKKWMASTKPGAVLSQITAVGWLSANAMIEGIKAAGVSCPTRKAFINNLRLENGYTADGFFSDLPINFAKVYGKPFTCVYYVHVENKQFVPQFNGKPFCAKQLVTDKRITKLVPATTAAPPTTTAAPAATTVAP